MIRHNFDGLLVSVASKSFHYRHKSCRCRPDRFYLRCLVRYHPVSASNPFQLVLKQALRHHSEPGLLIEARKHLAEDLGLHIRKDGGESNKAVVEITKIRILWPMGKEL